MDLLLQTEGVEPQQPLPLQPGYRRLPRSSESTSEDRRLAQESLGVWRRHVSDQPLPDVFQPLGEHRTHDRGGNLSLL